MKSPTDDTQGFQGCVTQLEKPTFRCWVIVAKLEVFNSKHHLRVWCSKPQLWLSLVSTAGCGCVRKQKLHSRMQHSSRSLRNLEQEAPFCCKDRQVWGSKQRERGLWSSRLCFVQPATHPTSTAWGSSSSSRCSWFLSSHSLHQTLQGSRSLVMLHPTYREQAPMLPAHHCSSSQG